MKKLLLAALVAIISLSSCGNRPQNDIVIRTAHEKLIIRLDSLGQNTIMYGHQDDPFYGVSWQWEPNRSDTKELLEDYPAVMGFDLGGIEMADSANLDSVPFDWIKSEAIDHYLRGGIVTFSWHPRNPRTGGNAWDVSDTTVVKNILPGGEQHELFVQWMERVATFLESLKLKDGRHIPFIFRPWHEYNGSWFWWGQKLCSAEDFKALNFMFQDYMKKKMPTNIVWCFSPNLQGNWTEEDFLTRYPGDSCVDMIGCDAYQWGKEEDFQKGLAADLQFLTGFAKGHQKLFAMTECGMQNSPVADWWSRVFLPLVEPYDVCYFLPWRNWNAEHFGFSKDVSTADDVKQLYQDKKFRTLQDIAPIGILTGRDSSEIIWL